MTDRLSRILAYMNSSKRTGLKAIQAKLLNKIEADINKESKELSECQWCNKPMVLIKHAHVPMMYCGNYKCDGR